MKNSYPPLNWKQKILRNILVFLNNEKYSRLKVFKIAFLLGRNIRFYDFVPYKYGPYSFEMDKDLRIFIKNGWINMENNQIYINKHIIKSLDNNTDNTDETREVINKFGNRNETNLLNYVYENYPFYIQNSLLINQQKSKKQTVPISIYTIGYQNLSIDLFINILIEKQIKTVLDVRNKPFSYKYGFNYSWLKKYLLEFDIEYINIPELGIEEKYRKTLLHNQLWEYYSIVLENNKKYLDKISNIIIKGPTVLMCYEMNPNDCHRLRLAKAIQDSVNLLIVNFDIETKQWIKLELEY